MATPYSTLQKSFHSRFKSNYAIITDLEEQYLINSLGDFELYLYPLTYVATYDGSGNPTGNIATDLSFAELNLLGALMYKHYLEQEIDGVLKLQNIVGKDIALTGIGQSKQEYNRRLDKVMIDINSMINGFKPSSYSQQD